MKTVLFRVYGGLEVLEYTDFPTPEPKPGEELIRLHVAAAQERLWKNESFGKITLDIS